MKLLFCAVALAAVSASAADLPKAETILDRYVEVTGGRQVYEKRTNEYTSGLVEVPAAGVKGKVEMWAAAPGSRVEVIEMDGVGRIESGTDGVIAWENSAIMGPKLRSGLELRYHLRDALFNQPIHWRKIYKSAETVAVEKVEGADCFRLLMTPVEGKPETWYFDQKNGFLVKMLKTSLTTMGEVNGEYLLKDYKEADGLIVPFTLIQKAAQQEIIVKIDAVKPNIKMPKDRFTPPVEVKPLLVPMKKAA